jgi:hypothetical protein
MKRVQGSFWTPERDRRLEAYEAEGLSGAVIAERLGTTRNAVLGRSQRLRGLTLTYQRYLKKKREWRAAGEPQRREKQRRERAAMERMGKEIAKGVPRNFAIVSARKRGATYRAIGEEIGMTRQGIEQICKRTFRSARH